MGAFKVQLIDLVQINTESEVFDVNILKSLPKNCIFGHCDPYAVFPEWKFAICSCHNDQIIVHKGKYKVGDILYIEYFPAYGVIQDDFILIHKINDTNS